MPGAKCQEVSCRFLFGGGFACKCLGRLAVSFVLALTLGLPAGADEPIESKAVGVNEEVVVVEAGRVITISGEELENAAVVIEKGRIVQVGKDVKAPWNAQVFKFPRGTVTPGFIAVHTTAGLRVPNENVPNAAYISVLDGLDPSSPAIRSSLRDGVTIAHVIPANATRLGGQGAVVRTTGRTIEDMVIRAPSALKISLRPPVGETRMQTIAALRRTFLDLYFQARDILAEASPAQLSGKPAVEATLTALVEARAPWAEIAWEKVALDKLPTELRPLVDVVRGKLPCFIYCPRASDVFKAFELIDANHLAATLVLGPDAYKLAEVLKARSNLGAVVLDAELVSWEIDPDSGEELRHITPRALYDAGISFALQTVSDGRDQGPRFSREGELHLWYQAATLVRHGVPRAEALRSITLTPARILGLDHRLGSLEPTKDGTLVIWSGDPLDARSWVEVVLIDGKEVYRRDKDRDLEELSREPVRSF